MSPFGYKQTTRPRRRHVCLTPSFGHSNADVGFQADFVRFNLCLPKIQSAAEILEVLPLVENCGIRARRILTDCQRES